MGHKTSSGLQHRSGFPQLVPMVVEIWWRGASPWNASVNIETSLVHYRIHEQGNIDCRACACSAAVQVSGFYAGRGVTRAWNTLYNGKCNAPPRTSFI